MPIEFNCRICNAMIRVPDNAAGGKGRCPKCGLRITVPKKSPPKPVIKSPEPEEQFFTPGMGEGPSIDEGPAIPDDPEAVIELEPAAFDPSDLTDSPPLGVLPFDRVPVTSPTKSISKRMKKRKTKGNPVIIAVIVAVVLIAGAAWFLVPVLTAERLGGELIAGTSLTLELPPVTIEKSKIRIPSEELAVLLKKLEASPIPLTSNSMQIELAGSAKGLRISISPGAQAQFYRVSVKGKENIQKYLDKHIAELDEQRLKEIDQSATEFFVEYQRVISKKSTSENIPAFRDTLALPALVGGFGHNLVASVGRSLYPCVYEDRDGGLYFLLPAEVQSFQVIGREAGGGRIQIPAEFIVKVEGAIDHFKKKDDQKTPSDKTAKPKPTQEEPAMDGEEMDGKK